MVTKRSFKRGGVTVELIAACLLIGVPVMLAFAQLGRLDVTARRLQYQAQETCLASAVKGNGDPSFRLISVECRESLSMGPEWMRIPGASGHSVTLKRRYWIGTGSGYGEDW